MPALNTAVSGMKQLQLRMDVIANNIANVNTTAFKAAETDLADSFSQTLAQAGSGSLGVQVGTGTQTVATKNDFTQGDLSRTGVLTDLGISGEGFFNIKDPLSNTNYVTRDGTFHVDSNNYLVTDAGMRVQGYSDAITLSTIGDIQIDLTGIPNPGGATLAAFSVDTDGKVMVRLSDGSQYARGQVLLQTYANPQALQKAGNNLFNQMSAAGPSAPTAPGTAGFGTIQAGTLELSNVDLAGEFSTMITTQRAFQANSRTITTADQMLQDVVNLVR